MPFDSCTLDKPVLSVARTDVRTFRQDFTVRQTLNAIREQGLGERIVYFYVVDDDDRLVGVLPTRRLLAASPERRLSEIMVDHVETISSTATIMDACESFVHHKYLAYPVVDEEGRVIGVVDVGMLTPEIVDIGNRGQVDEVFEMIGFRVGQVREASPARAFRFRFPWLLTTIGSGTICALLAGLYEATLAESLVLAFFLTLVLGLGESVSIQSMTVTIQSLRAMRPTLKWFLKALRREAGTSLLLGASCGVIVAAIVWLWRGDGLPAVSIGASILLTLIAACLTGFCVPSLLHALKLDPKVSAGPITLAIADICTLLIYFNMAVFLL